MPIVVDHTPSGLTSVIAAGLANAETRRRKEYDDKQTLDTRRLDIADQANDLNQRQFEAQQADIPLARQHARDMIAMQYDRASQLAAEKAAAERAERDEAEQQAMAAMSPMQKRTLAQLDEDEAKVMNSVALAPVARAAMLAQIQDKRFMVKSQRPTMSGEPPKAEMVADQSSGGTLIRQPNGEMRPGFSPKEIEEGRKLRLENDQMERTGVSGRSNPDRMKRYNEAYNRVKGRKQPDDAGNVAEPTDEEIVEEMRRMDRVLEMYDGGTPTSQATVDPAAAQPAAATGVAATIDPSEMPVEIQQDPSLDRTWKVGKEEFTTAELAVAARHAKMPLVDFMLSRGFPVTRQQSQSAAAAGGPAPAAAGGPAPAAAGGPAPAAAAPAAAMPAADPAGPPLPNSLAASWTRRPQPVARGTPLPSPAMPEGPLMVSDDEMKRRQRLVPATSFVTKWFLSNPDHQFISRVPGKATITAAELVAIAVQTNTLVDEVYAKYVDVKAERQRGRASRPPL